MTPTRFYPVWLCPLGDPEPPSLDEHWRERAFRGLPPTHRIALTLVVAQGLGYAEVGQVLGQPVGVVRRLVYEAREVMRLAALHTLPVGRLPTTLVMEEARK